MNNRKILFVSGNLLIGGAQRVISLLANDFARTDWSVHIALLLDDKIENTIEDSIQIHNIVHKGNRLLAAKKWIKELRSVILEVKPDVIVSFVGRINLITLLAAKGTNIPVLVSERNDPLHDSRNSLELFLCKRAYKKAALVVFQTDYQSRFFHKYCSDKSVIIGNPLLTPAYEGEHENKDIICVGKLRDQKNHLMMINAFSSIASSFPDVNVYIYGEGILRETLEKAIKVNDLVDRVHLEGNNKDIFRIMQKNEYFVMCSNYEGLSNALLEALASGMICISTSWDGVEDVIVDGNNGYLVPVNDVNALAEKLTFVLNNDNSGIRKNAIETGKKYSCGTVLSQWHQAIEGLIR